MLKINVLDLKCLISATLLVLVSGCVAASTNNAIAKGISTGKLPPVELANLNGDDLKLPDDFPAESNLIVFGFAHEQKEVVQEWINAVAEIRKDYPQVSWYKVPVIDNSSAALRAMIRNGMRSGTSDEELLEKTYTLFTDQQSFAQALGLPSVDSPSSVLFDKEGSIKWQASGPVSREGLEQLRTAIADDTNRNTLQK